MFLEKDMQFVSALSSSAVTRSSRDWMAAVVAGGCRVHGQVCHLRVGQLPCGDVRALSVVQDLRDCDQSLVVCYEFVTLGVIG